MRYRLVTDNDGHDYIIPAQDEDRFYAWVESTETDDEEYDGPDYEGRRVNRSGWTFTDPQGWK